VSIPLLPGSAAPPPQQPLSRPTSGPPLCHPITAATSHALATCDSRCNQTTPPSAITCTSRKFQLTQRLSLPQPGPKHALANPRIEPLFILKWTHPAPPCLCLLLRVTSVAAPMPPTHRCLYHLQLPLGQLLVPCLVQHLTPLPLHCCSAAPQPLPLPLLLLLAAFLEDLVV